MATLTLVPDAAGAGFAAAVRAAVHGTRTEDNPRPLFRALANDQLLDPHVNETAQRLETT